MSDLLHAQVFRAYVTRFEGSVLRSSLLLQLKDAAPAFSYGREEMNGESPELYKARDLAAAESSPASGFALNRANEDIGQKGRTGRHYLPLEQRIRAYKEVLRLRKQGLSYKEIINAIHRLQGIRIAASTLDYWVRGVRSPLTKLNKFNAEPSPILAYVIGVKAGDGYLHKQGHQYGVELQTKDREFAEHTGRCLATLLGREKPYRPRWRRRRCLWHVKGRSFMLC